MAITAITINQDNVVNSSNLMPVHSPLVFIVDVDYTGSTPDSIDVEIYDIDDNLLETYSAIPYNDITITQREFLFKSSGPLKALMESFDDFLQLNNTLEYVEDITKQFKIRFVDPENALIYDEVTIDAVHGASQFGEYPNLDDQYNNENDTYYAALDGIVYVYFYNNDANNTIEVSTGTLTEGNALDYDDSIFTDYDDSIFTIFTIV
jgi:hypothetical protein